MKKINTILAFLFLLVTYMFSLSTVVAQVPPVLVSNRPLVDVTVATVMIADLNTTGETVRITITELGYELQWVIDIAYGLAKTDIADKFGGTPDILKVGVEGNGEFLMFEYDGDTWGVGDSPEVCNLDGYAKTVTIDFMTAAALPNWQESSSNYIIAGSLGSIYLTDDGSEYSANRTFAPWPVATGRCNSSDDDGKRRLGEIDVMQYNPVTRSSAPVADVSGPGHFQSLVTSDVAAVCKVVDSLTGEAMDLIPENDADDLATRTPLSGMYYFPNDTFSLPNPMRGVLTKTMWKG